MRYKGILLVEDNTDDELMTLEALNMDLIGEVKVVRDGVEALDYLFSKGAYAKRSIMDLPAVVLLDLKLPKIDGLEVLNRWSTWAGESYELDAGYAVSVYAESARA